VRRAGRLAALLVPLLGACVGRTWESRIGSTMVVATLACDWSQTVWAAGHGRGNWHERNMILGDSPTVGEIGAYMATAMLTTLIVGELLPERYRLLLYGTVTVVELHSNMGNQDRWPTEPICGVL
jgi:hypothetical protein